MLRGIFFILFVLIISIVDNEARISRFKSIRSSSYERSVRENIERLIQTNPVMVFSQINCRYSKKAKDILSKYLGGNFKVLEIDPNNSASDIYYDIFEQLTGAATLPRVYIGGKFVGGGDDMETFDKNGYLRQLLRNARVIFK